MAAWSRLKCWACWVSNDCLVTFKVKRYIDLFQCRSALVLLVSSQDLSLTDLIQKLTYFITGRTCAIR